jgi:muconolactone delta-isomerase
VKVPTATAADAIADLRQRRRDMRRELARVRWWRRLVNARRELALAFLAQPDAHSSAGLDPSWEALAAGAPTS